MHSQLGHLAGLGFVSSWYVPWGWKGPDIVAPVPTRETQPQEQKLKKLRSVTVVYVILQGPEVKKKKKKKNTEP